MTATVQVHKRSPRDGFLKWIIKAITVAALNYGMREALDLFKDWIQGLLPSISLTERVTFTLFVLT